MKIVLNDKRRLAHHLHDAMSAARVEKKDAGSVDGDTDDRRQTHGCGTVTRGRQWRHDEYDGACNGSLQYNI
jgi:hypothetical protein